jgi:hypothetical protein
MNEFVIAEDFPKNQKEFDRRFCDESACIAVTLALRLHLLKVRPYRVLAKCP